MPTITRWFNVSHDINADPEMWELREQFTDRAAMIWLECLSIADRNSGVVGPSSDHTRNQLASKCRTSRAKVLAVIEWCLSHGWLKVGPRPNLDSTSAGPRPNLDRAKTGPASDQCLQVTKWAKYNKHRGVKNSPSEPSEPTLPNQTKPKKKKKKNVDDVYSVDFQKAWQVNGYGSKRKAFEAWKKQCCDTVIEKRDLVMNGLLAEAEWRERAEAYRLQHDPNFFIPPWANLSTWINDGRWEQTLRPIPKGNTNGKAEPAGWDGVRDYLEIVENRVQR